MYGDTMDAIEIRIRVSDYEAKYIAQHPDDLMWEEIVEAWYHLKIIQKNEDDLNGTKTEEESQEE